MSTVEAVVPALPVSHRFRRSAVGRLMRHSNGVIGIAIIAAVLLLALLAPWVTGQDPNAQNLMARLKPPVGFGGTWAHALGTDHLGRDIATRVVYGARVSLFVGFATALIAGVLGTAVGLVAGFFDGFARTFLMRLVDVFLAIPYILFAVVVVGAIGAGITNLILVLALTRWVQFARIVYGQTLSVREKEYVEAAKVRGNSRLRVLLVHVLPNVATPIIVVMTLEVAFMIIMESALTFLGLGVSPETPSWGWMLAEGKDYMSLAWWLTVVPGLTIMATVLGINLLGDALRDTFDPRLKV